MNKHELQEETKEVLEILESRLPEEEMDRVQSLIHELISITSCNGGCFKDIWIFEEGEEIPLMLGKIALFDGMK